MQDLLAQSSFDKLKEGTIVSGVITEIRANEVVVDIGGKAEGVIPANEADDLFITVGVFIHWEAKDDKKIQDFNYRATKEAIARAVKGEPKASTVTAEKDKVKHPFAAA